MHRYVPKDPSTWVPKHLFSAYLGEHSEKIMAYYDRAVAKKNPVVLSLNWLGILVLPAWLAYRQQWALWGTLTALFGILPFVEQAAGLAVPNGAFGGIAVALGLFGHGLLLGQANGLYAKLKASGTDDASIEAKMKNRAAPSIPLAIAGGVASVAITVALAFVAELVL